MIILTMYFYTVMCLPTLEEESPQHAQKHPLLLLMLLPCELPWEHDGQCTQVSVSEPALNGSLGVVTLNSSQPQVQLCFVDNTGNRGRE